MAYDAREIRVATLERVRKFGLSVSVALPLLDPDLRPRSAVEIEKRILALYSVVAASYGFDRARALSWVQDNVGLSSLSTIERRLLEQPNGDMSRCSEQVEGLFAFAWALSLVSELDFSKHCPGNFYSLFPNIKLDENASAFRNRCALRSVWELVSALDLAYCLHWCLKDASLEGKGSALPVQAHVIVERRRALDWILSDADWDELTLDT